MYCRKCGNELKGNAKFCGKCGTSINIDLSNKKEDIKPQVITKVIERKEQPIIQKTSSLVIYTIIVSTIITSTALIIGLNLLK